MTDETSAEPEGEGSTTPVVRRRRRVPRLLGWGLIGLSVLLVAAALVLWIQRRPLATDILSRELARRGVQASFTVDRVGLRTQQVSDLVIGDPRRPEVDAIDWVERIPFTETRNYVQRVMENLQVYRNRLDGKSALMIERDLARGARTAVSAEAQPVTP